MIIWNIKTKQTIQGLESPSLPLQNGRKWYKSSCVNDKSSLFIFY